MIVGERISLRPFDREHLERTRQWVNDPELSALLGRARPVSDAEHEGWYERLRAGDDVVIFAVVRNRDDRHVGNVWLCEVDSRHRRAEARILLGEPDGRGAGYGPESLELLARYARERLNLHKLRAFVLGHNPRAKRGFEKAGFEVEGILRSDRWARDGWVDVWILGRILG